MSSPQAPPRVLITGATGFVGAEIVASLHAAHPTWVLIATDLNPPTRDPHDPFPLHSPNVTFYYMDITSPPSITTILTLTKPTLIIHTAGVSPVGLDRYTKSPSVCARVNNINVNGTRHMLAAARAAHITKFLYTGSCCAQTDEQSRYLPNFTEAHPLVDPARALLYGASKAAAETLVLAAHAPGAFDTTVLRPSTIFGRMDYQLVPAIQACIAKGETPWQIGPGDNLYDMTYVGNVADAHTLAVENLLGLMPRRASCAGEAVLISNDQPITFRDFMLAIWSHWGHRPAFVVVIPGGLAWAVGAVAEAVGWVVGGKATLCRGSVRDALGTRYASQEKAKRLLGYEPKVSMWEGLRISCEALKARQAAAAKQESA